MHLSPPSRYESQQKRRMLWGGDLSRLRGSYGDCLAQFQEGLDFLSADDDEWILGKSLAEVLKWPDPAAR